MGRVRRATAATAACVTIAAVGASALAGGDRFSFAGDDYAGKHRRHPKQAMASDYFACTLTRSGSALCGGTFAIGGSMIMGDDFVQLQLERCYYGQDHRR
jgi:hypothetical protein